MRNFRVAAGKISGENFKGAIKFLAKILASFFALFCGLNFAFAAQIVVKNDEILSPAVAGKISQIGDELYAKSKILAAVAVYESLGEQSLQQAVKSLNLTAPYAVIALAKRERKVEIFADPATLKLFDKERILSPFPERGTILPILTSKNTKDVYNAAILNGYADLTEQIAASLGVKLESAIGDANKTALNALRAAVYGSVILVFAVMIYKKARRQNKLKVKNG